MQIIADVREIWKTFHADLTFILNVLLESKIQFAWFSIVLARKNDASFT